MFGWGEFRGMENIGRKIGWKTVFSTVLQKKENWEEGKRRRKFSLLGPQNSSSQIGRKRLERKCSHDTFTKTPSPNVYNNPVRQNKKKEAENNHPTTKPSTTTKHHNLAQKINILSIWLKPTLDVQCVVSNHTFLSPDPLIRKPNSKSRQTHWKTQLKINQNSLGNPTQNHHRHTTKSSKSF